MIYYTCNNCGEELELCEDNFYRDKNSSTGFRRTCKSCRKTYDKELREMNTSSVKQAATRKVRSTSGFSSACMRDRLKEPYTLSIYK